MQLVLEAVSSLVKVALATYPHVVSGLQEVAAQRFDGTLDGEALKLPTDGDLANKDTEECRQRGRV